MGESYNIYCDESCHLLNPNIKPMVLGGIWCPKDKVKEIHQRIREIKSRNKASKIEVKWTKVSESKVSLYLDLLDYFFDDDDLHFRGVVIPDKSLLKHELFEQTHDEFYYKMFFILLKVVLSPKDHYDIYLDYKDTLGHERITKLREVLSNNFYDFDRKIVQKIQLVKSHQVELIQLTDLLIGALSYEHRKLKGNRGKIKIIERIVERSGYDLQHNTLYRENKFNLLIWESSCL